MPVPLHDRVVATLACPVEGCGADASEWCRDASGKRLPGTALHDARVKAYRRIVRQGGRALRVVR